MSRYVNFLLQNMLQVSGATIILMVSLAFASANNDIESNTMNETSLQALQNEYQSELMLIDGIVSISVGLCDDGSRCLKIGTSKPITEIRPLLPEALNRPDVILENFGEIQAE